MLDNWLSPVNAALFPGGEWQPFQVGHQIQVYDGKLPSLKDVKVVLIGIGEGEANPVRRELYRMSFPFEGLQVADLGNIRRRSVSFLLAPIRELVNSRIFPILIGGDPTLALAQYKAFLSLQSLISLVLVDEQLHVSDAPAQDPKQFFLNELIHNQPSRPFHLSFLGPQTHFTDPACFRLLERHHFECVRLGRARANLSELEPIIRDGDLLSLNLACLKSSEAPAVSGASPSGFFLEEACQISRYAGMSDKLKSLGIFGYRHDLDAQQLTAQAIAQLIWYFLDGFYNRKNDFPASTEGLVEYIVDFKKMEYQLTFWKSQKSGRWWMQIPVKTGEQYQRHRLIPCSYNDYKLACQEELPERLLNAFKRFS